MSLNVLSLKKMACSLRQYVVVKNAFGALDAAPDSGYATMQSENALVKQQAVASGAYVSASAAVSQQPPTATGQQPPPASSSTYYGSQQVPQGDGSSMSQAPVPTGEYQPGATSDSTGVTGEMPPPSFEGPVSSSCVDSAGEFSESSGAEWDKRLGRKKTGGKRRKTQERLPRLTVLRLDGSMLECQLETSKQKTVTFVFDSRVMVPEDIARNLVVSGLLPEQHAELFVEQLVDVVRQIKDNPDKLPVVYVPDGSCSSPGQTRKHAGGGAALTRRSDSREDPQALQQKATTVSQQHKISVQEGIPLSADPGSSPTKRPLQTPASAPPTLASATIPTGPSSMGSRFLVSPVQDAVSQQQASVVPGSQAVTSDVAAAQTLPPQALQQQEAPHPVSAAQSLPQPLIGYGTQAGQVDPLVLSAGATTAAAGISQLSQQYQQAVADLGAVYGHPQSLDPTGMLHNIPGFPQTLELAWLRQRLALFNMQLGGDRLMQQLLLSSYAPQLATGDPSLMHPQGGVPQPQMGSYVPPAVTTTAAAPGPGTYQPHSMQTYPPAGEIPGIPELPSSPPSPRRMTIGTTTLPSEPSATGGGPDTTGGRPRKVTANLENLDQQLRKLHSPGNVTSLRRDSQAPSLPPFSQGPAAQTPTAASESLAASLPNVATTSAAPVATQGVPASAPKSPVRRLSRFRVTTVVDDPLRGSGSNGSTVPSSPLSDAAAAEIKPVEPMSPKGDPTPSDGAVVDHPSSALPRDGGLPPAAAAPSGGGPPVGTEEKGPVDTQFISHTAAPATVGEGSAAGTTLFRKSTRSFSVPSPQGGNHIPSARVNPLVHVTPAAVRGTSTPTTPAITEDRTTTTTEGGAPRLLLLDGSGKTLTSSTKSLPSTVAPPTASQSTAELVSSSLELALAQIMKGVVSKMAADMQSQTLDRTVVEGEVAPSSAGQQPPQQQPPQDEPSSSKSRPQSPSSTSSPAKKSLPGQQDSDLAASSDDILAVSRVDVGVQTDRPITRDMAINTPRPVTSASSRPATPRHLLTPGHLQVGGLHKTKSETTLNQLGLSTPVTSATAAAAGQRPCGVVVQRPKTLGLMQGGAHGQQQYQRGQSYEDAEVPPSGPAARLVQYPGSLDLTKVGLESSSPSVTLTVPFVSPLSSSASTTGLSRTKSCVDISQVGVSAPSTPTGHNSHPGSLGLDGSQRGHAGGVAVLPSGGGGERLQQHQNQMLLGGGNLHRARSLWDVSHARTASAGDVPLSQLAARRSAAVADELSRDRPASVSDMSQLGFVPKPKRALDLGRAVPFGQFLSSLVQNSTPGHERSPSSDEEVLSDEHLRRILTRHQREKLELEQKHQVEIENFRRRKKMGRQTSAPTSGGDEQLQGTAGAGGGSSVGTSTTSPWTSPPRSIPTSQSNGLGGHPPHHLFKTSQQQHLTRSTSSTPLPGPSPLAVHSMTVLSPSYPMPSSGPHNNAARSYSDGLAALTVGGGGTAKSPGTFSEEILRMFEDGSTCKADGGGLLLQNKSDVNPTEPKLTLNQMKSLRQHLSDGGFQQQQAPTPPSSSTSGSSTQPHSPPSPSMASCSGGASSGPPLPNSGSLSSSATAASAAPTPGTSWPPNVSQLHGYQTVTSATSGASHRMTSSAAGGGSGSAPVPTHPWLHQLSSNVYPKQGASWGGLPQGISPSTFLHMMHQQQQQYHNPHSQALHLQQQHHHHQQQQSPSGVGGALNNNGGTHPNSSGTSSSNNNQPQNGGDGCGK